MTRLQDDWERTPPAARVFYVLAAAALLLSFVIDGPGAVADRQSGWSAS